MELLFANTLAPFEPLLQVFQNNVDEHAAAVSSVLGLCDLLLTDMDACSSVAELSSLREARQSLNTRWHCIATLIIERKIGFGSSFLVVH